MGARRSTLERSRTVFTSDQNRVLRRVLRRLKNERKLSQMGLARLLGIAQQNAGRLLAAEANDKNGFAYDTATRLVRELGFSGVDAFFETKGVSLPKSA